MTDEEAQAIAARAEAATPGPWEVKHPIGGDSRNEVTWTYGAITYSIALCRNALDGQKESDAAFIARARSDIPALLAERAALRELLGSVVAYVPRTVPDPEIVNIQAHARALLAGDGEEQ